MKIVSLAAAASLVLASLPAAAQGRPAPRGGGKPPAAAEPGPPPIYPCRTKEETCFLGIAIGGQLAVIYTNAENAAGIEAKPVEAAGPDGAKLDLGKSDGRVVMLAGAYDPKAGITKAEIVEVASPLASLAVKAQLAGGRDEPQGRSAPPRRR